MIYDGADRLDVRVAYEAQSGRVLLADQDASVYHDEDRPHGAPTGSGWRTDRLAHDPRA